MILNILWIIIFSFLISVSSLTCPSWYTQVCRKCRGDMSVCCPSTVNPATPEDCFNLVDGVSTLATHYYPAVTGCAVYTCDDNSYFSDSDRWQARKTTSADCKTFTLSQTLSYSVTDTPYDTSSTSRGACFKSCFNLDGCLTFHFDADTSTCKRYVSCGTSCSFQYTGDSDDEIYVRSCEDRCPELTSSATYTVSMACGRNHGDTAEYTCVAGYTMTSGSSTTTCQSDSTWTDSPPTCTASDCGQPSAPTYGSVDTSSGTGYNDVATYSCNIGYSLSGSTTTSCQADGTWNNGAPTCTLVDCGSPASLTNGAVDTSSGTQYTNTASYSCNTGYTLTGSSTTTCQADGTWNNGAPTCTKVDCGSPPSLTNGAVDTSSGTQYSDTATYSCNTGYTLSGSSTTTCQGDGTWNNGAPTCTIVDCGSPASPTNGAVDTSSGTQYSNTASYSCNTGYTLSGSSTTTCQADGTWNNGAPTCTIVECGSPASPTNGAVDTSSGTQYGNTASYSCNTGYTLSGSSTTTCQADGTWNNGAPTCTLVDCGTPTSPSNGAVSAPSGTQYGDSATYSCDTGYSLTGSSTITCQADGSWSSSAPTCSLVGCGSLSPPTFGSVDTSSGTNYNDIATFSCDSGYNLSGSSSSTCQGDGTWTNTAPLCNPVDCSGLPNPSYGSVSTPSGTTFQNVAVYLCNTGYSVSGSSTRTCQANSQWSGSEPSCNLIDCGSPPAPIYGSVSTPDGTLFATSALYSCGSGYNLVGVDNRTCQSNSAWSSSVPVCSPFDCGPLANPTNGNVVALNTTYGAIATFTCNTGYSLSGSGSISCDVSSWSPLPPTCPITDCGLLSNPINGMVNVSGGTTYGSTANYSCISGYYLSHVQTRTCTSSGSWSLSAPTCVPNGVVLTTPAPEVIYIMSCLCNTNSTFENLTQEQSIHQLVQDTAIETNSTALALSKYISMDDPRQSSKIVGLAGTAIIGAVAGLILLIDILTVFRK